MIISIHQPNYIPWMGYFYKIFKSDVFVILDDVQYTKNSYINRNQIKTSQGAAWLTIPVAYKGNFGCNINEIKTKDELKWKDQHLKTIEMNYKRSNYYNPFFEVFKDVLTKDYNTIADLNASIIKNICEIFNFETKIVLSSGLDISGTSTERLINICQTLGADKYLSGKGGSKYQDEAMFTENSIQLIYSDFKQNQYNQLWGNFIGNLSVLDFIFNYGYDIKKFWE